jgi:hypothetical protein
MVKVNFTLEQATKARKYSATLSLTSGLDGMGGQRHAAASLPPGKKTGNHFIGDWVGPTTGLIGCGKSCPPPGFDPRTFQSVATRYTDYAIPNPFYCTVTNIFKKLFSTCKIWFLNLKIC